MIKQNINIINLTTLYNILNEMIDHLSFKVLNFNNLDDFFKHFNKNKIDYKNLIILTNISHRELLLNKKEFTKENIFFLSKKKNNYEIINEHNSLEYPLEIANLVERINVLLIKQKYNYQSKIKINNYYLDLNSKIISNEKNN